MKITDTTDGVVRLKAIRIARPTIFNLGLERLSTGDVQEVAEIAQLGRWGWVSTHELTRCVDQLFIGHGVARKNPTSYGWDNMFDRFGLLNGMVSGMPRVTYVFPFYYPRNQTGGKCHYYINCKNWGHAENELYVPALWSNAIIDLVSRGIIRVTAELGVPNGYYTIGHTASGEKKVLVAPSGSSGKWSIRDE